MTSVQDFLKFLLVYQSSSPQLSKCGAFVKRRSKGSDLTSFCAANCDQESLNTELNGLLEENKRKLRDILISSYHIDGNRICLKLDRISVIRSVLSEISACQSAYGISNVFEGKAYKITLTDAADKLSRLRMSIAAQVMSALISMGGGSVVTTGHTDDVVVVPFSHIDNKNSSILVRPIYSSGKSQLSKRDFIELRTEDIISLSNHKNLSEEAVRQAVNAAVIFDLLSIKLDKPSVLDLAEEPRPSRQPNCRGALFVLYNYARLCAILNKFDYGVANSIFPPLTSLQEVNYNLLSEENEWSLVFEMLADWPAVVADCQTIQQPKIHRLIAFLSSLSSTFSVYYRHTRVLNDGLAHMLPLMEARIHLLLAIKQVLLVAFSILGITAPTTI